MRQSVEASHNLHSLLAEYATLPEYSGLPLKDVNQASLFGDRPINIAATRGILWELAILLDNGADINNKGEHNYSPLHNAVEQGHSKVVEFLLDHNADKTILNDDGKTAADLAVILDENEIRQLLWATR